jgi:hypothetical protein
MSHPTLRIRIPRDNDVSVGPNAPVVNPIPPPPPLRRSNEPHELCVIEQRVRPGDTD